MIYKLSNQMQLMKKDYINFVLLFITSVLLLSISSVINKIKFYKVNEDIYSPITVVDLSKINKINIIVFLLGIILLFTALRYLYCILKKNKLENKFAQLTKSEKRIVLSICENKFNKEIAAEFNISISTLKTHINNINKKMEINTRRELIELKNKLKTKN